MDTLAGILLALIFMAWFQNFRNGDSTKWLKAKFLNAADPKPPKGSPSDTIWKDLAGAATAGANDQAHAQAPKPAGNTSGTNPVPHAPGLNVPLPSSGTAGTAGTATGTLIDALYQIGRGATGDDGVATGAGNALGGWRP